MRRKNIMSKGIMVNGASGRIGKFVTYELLKEGLDVVALHDIVSIDELVYNYTKRDSTHGLLDWNVQKVNEYYVDINGKRIEVHQKIDVKTFKFDALGIQIIEECSGLYAKKLNPCEFMHNGIERVIMSYPAAQKDATIIMGVNHRTYDPSQHRLISNASCTTKAIATPLALLRHCGMRIESLLMDTVHAATNSQHLLDFAGDYAALNQISTHKTGAAIATAEVLPDLLGKMDGLSFRVPTTDGSFANMYFVGVHNEGLTSQLLNHLFTQFGTSDTYAGRLAIHLHPEAASADIIGRTENSILIPSKTRVFPLPFPTEHGKQSYLISLVCGYDNERGPPKDQALLTKYIIEQREYAGCIKHNIDVFI